MGKPRGTVTFDQDVYDELNDREDRTGKNKSELVSDGLRSAWLTEDQESGHDVPNFQTTLGQSLFVAGPLVALLSQLPAGVGMMVLGLGLLIYGPMQRHMARGDSVGEAFKATLLH